MMLSEKQQQQLTGAMHRLANGESMASIGRDPKMPGATTLYDWIDADETGKRAESYARARERQADFGADEIREIADNQDLDPNSRRIMVDARKWIAAKLKPRVYGDKIDHKHSGSLTIGIRQNDRVSGD
jgi:hypothetical protein